MASLVAEITGRKIGVEIEVVVPIIGVGSNRDVQELLARILTAQGIRSVVRGYCHQPIPEGCKLAVEHDASLRDESRYEGLGWSKLEVKTAPMQWTELERVLPPALDVIRYFGARVNHSCGLHVHHELSEVVEHSLIARNLQHLWWRFHRVIYGLVALSRKQNSYCGPPSQEDACRFDSCRTYDQLCRELRRCERQRGLNLTNLTDSGRRAVEWRIHGGTTDWAKIAAWILATQRWVEHAAQRSCQYRPEPVPNTQAALNSLLITTGLKPNSRIYLKVAKELREVGKFLLRRWQHFNNST